MRGDTIIEVILAVAVFSLVAVGAMTLMNNGVAMVQRSLEITLARQQIDSQAEMLRYVHSRAQEDQGGTYAKLWHDEIKDKRLITSSPQSILGDNSSDGCPTEMPPKGFALVPSSSAGNISITDIYTSPVTYPKVEAGVSQSQGLSVQVVRVTDGGVYAYDAYIQACWYTPGSPRPVTLGTIVRLYDPSAKS